MKSNSHMIVSKETGLAVIETWLPLPKLYMAVNLTKYEIKNTYDYLCDLNAKIKLDNNNGLSITSF